MKQGSFVLFKAPKMASARIQQQHSKTVDGLEIQMGTNHLSHFAYQLANKPKNDPNAPIVTAAAQDGQAWTYKDIHRYLER